MRALRRRAEPPELTLGPARITLGKRDASAGPPHRSILFFETDDVAATYDILAARGAKPTVPEDVNWIKMRMIEIRDPDGNTLWFGNGFGGPNKPVAQRMLRSVMPELPFNDVSRGGRALPRRARLRDQLSAARPRRHGPRRHATPADRTHAEAFTGIGSCGFYVTDADALHAELVAKGANVQGRR